MRRQDVRVEVLLVVDEFDDGGMNVFFVASDSRGGRYAQQGDMPAENANINREMLGPIVGGMLEALGREIGKRLGEDGAR